jgi:hypothetical protein
MTPEGLDRMRVDIATRSGSRQLVQRLRSHLTTFGRPFLETPTFDWAEIVKAHRRTPLADRPLALLAEQDGCPSEIRREAETAQSMTGDHRRGRWPAPVTWNDTRPRRHRPPTEHAIVRSVAAGQTPIGDVLTDVRAALGAELLGMRDTVAPSASAAGELSEGLRQLLSDAGGDEQRRDRGVVALRLLQDFEGSLAELIATADTATRS